MPSYAGKKGPRRKTGCLACRSRHTRCDEAIPKCGRCAKAGLRCERQPLVVYDPSTPLNLSKTCHQPHGTAAAATCDDGPSSFSGVAFLLRNYQDGIGVWMDLFDRQATYQTTLMKMAIRSDLIKNAICALSARQLALVQPHDHIWTFTAGQHYGESLTLLKDTLETRQQDPRLLLPASILLMSYELMSSPGVDYTRHFRGAQSLLESFLRTHTPIMNDGLLLNSCLLFLRHDVDIAMAFERPPKLALQYIKDFEQQNASDTLDEVGLGNRALLLTAQTLRLIYSLPQVNDEAVRLFREVEGWDKLAVDTIHPLCLDDGARWYPIPAGAAAVQAHLSNKILLMAYFPTLVDELEKELEACAQSLIEISLSNVSDAVQVRALQPLYQAAKRTNNTSLRQQAIRVLEDLELRTGFHTKTKVDALKAIGTRLA